MIDVNKTFYVFARYFILFFYFVYSVLPAIFSLICIYNGIQVFYWINLSPSDQFSISIFQIIGFLVLIFSLPRYKVFKPGVNYYITIPKRVVLVLAYTFFIITLPAFFEMLLRSRSVQGRELLFDLSSLISNKYQLKFIFLILSLLVLYLVHLTRSMKFLLLLVPCVLIEIISLGRVWPFALITLSLIAYIFINKRFIPFKSLLFYILIFALYSMIRLISLGGELDLLGNFIFLFGESFNTQQTIELAFDAKNNLDFYNKFANIISDYLPFGLRNIFVDSEHNVTSIIDSAKSSLYGSHVTMGFGSSWVSQYILFFGNNFMIIFYPLFLSLSLKIYLKISKSSELFSMIYLYFFISGLFMFFRYGLPLSLTYPLFNTIYGVLFFLLIKGAFSFKSKLGSGFSK